MMRKLSFNLLVILGIFGIVFTSCDDDDEIIETNPLVELTVSDTSVTSFTGLVGDELQLEVNVTDDDGLTEVVVTKVIDDVEDTQSVDIFDLTTNPTNFSQVVIYTLEEEDVGKTVYLKVEATDVNGNTEIRTVDLFVAADLTYSFSSVLLYAPLANFESQTFFGAESGATYSVNDIISTSEPVSDSVDFGYFYGQQFEATLASPSAYPIDYTTEGWIEQNETLLRKTNLTTSEVLEFENDLTFIENAFEQAAVGDNPQQVRNLLEGEVIAFQLDPDKGSRVGLIIIKEIVPGTGENEYIEIDVIAEKP